MTSISLDRWPKWEQVILFATIVSLGIGYPFFESAFGGKSVSLTDYLVIFFLPLIGWKYRKSLVTVIMSKKIVPTYIFLSSLLIPIFFHLEGDGWVSVIGWLRPCMMFVFVVLLFREYKETENTVVMASWTLGLITSTVGLLGWVAAVLLNIENPFVHIRPYYLGIIPIQLSALDGHPNGAALVLFIIITVLYFLNRDAKTNKVVIAVGILGMILTLSKSILIYSALVCLCITRGKRYSKVLINSVGVFILILYLIFTHALPQQVKDVHQNNASFYIYSQKPLVEYMGLSLVKTPYLANKIAAVQIFLEHPWTGVGPRNFVPAMEQMKLNGSYPAESIYLSPHCTYTSVLARFGLIGFLGLIYYMWWIWSSIKTVKNRTLRSLFSIVYFCFGLEAINSDLEYSHLFWFFNAWLMTCLLHQSSSSYDHEEYARQQGSNSQYQQ
jgi:hypothetical protein